MNQSKSKCSFSGNWDRFCSICQRQFIARQMWIFPLLLQSLCILTILLRYVNWKYVAIGLYHDMGTWYTNTEMQLLHLKLILFSRSMQSTVQWKSNTDHKPCSSTEYHIWFWLWVPLHTMVLILTWNFFFFFKFFKILFPAQYFLDLNEWLLDVLSIFYLLLQREYAVVVVWTQKLLVR